MMINDTSSAQSPSLRRSAMGQLLPVKVDANQSRVGYVTVYIYSYSGSCYICSVMHADAR